MKVHSLSEKINPVVQMNSMHLMGPLPGGAMYTRSIASADINDDGMIDILVGNRDQNNQLLLNDGDGSYAEAIDLPGGAMATFSIAAADVNGDGMVDLLIGNNNQNNQLL